MRRTIFGRFCRAISSTYLFGDGFAIRGRLALLKSMQSPAGCSPEYFRGCLSRAREEDALRTAHATARAGMIFNSARPSHKSRACHPDPAVAGEGSLTVSLAWKTRKYSEMKARPRPLRRLRYGFAPL